MAASVDKVPTKKRRTKLTLNRAQFGARLAAAGGAIALLTREARAGRTLSDARLAEMTQLLKKQLPHADAVHTTRWKPKWGDLSPSFSPPLHGKGGVAKANTPESLAHELAHGDLWNRFRDPLMAMVKYRAAPGKIGPLVGTGMALLANPKGRVAKYHWVPSALGALPTLLDEGQANVRGYLAARRAGLKPSVLPGLAGMATYVVGATAPIVAGHLLVQKRRRKAEAQARKDGAKKTAALVAAGVAALTKSAETPPAGVKERGPFPVGIDLARLEQHANEHRLMALLGIDHRGRPLISPAR